MEFFLLWGGIYRPDRPAILDVRNSQGPCRPSESLVIDSQGIRSWFIAIREPGAAWRAYTVYRAATERVQRDRCCRRRRPDFCEDALDLVKELVDVHRFGLSVPFEVDQLPGPVDFDFHFAQKWLYCAKNISEIRHKM